MTTDAGYSTGSLPKEVARQKVLVVDDNTSSLYATSRILRAAGFDVIEADSGGKALALADQVGLLVLDINLPDMDGFEVCRQLQRAAARRICRSCICRRRSWTRRTCRRASKRAPTAI